MQSTKIKHLVIITYNWPPRNAIGTHRPYAWAKAAAYLGHRVTILTSQKYGFDAPLDLDLPNLAGVKVIEVRWGGFARNSILNILNNKLLRLFIRRIRSILSRSIITPIEPRQGWLTAALPVAKKLALDADVVISTYGPSMAHELGSIMKKNNINIKWIADYRDLWSLSHIGNLTDKQRDNAKRLELATTGTYADLITGVSEDMVTKLSEFLNKPTLLLQNGFDVNEDEINIRLSSPKLRSKGPLRIVYTGMLYEGKRNPEPLLCALVELFEAGRIKEGDVFIDFYGSRIDVARKLAKKPEYIKFINIYGHVSREKSLRLQQDADLLLILESPEVEARGVLTGKIFEYITSGTPILSLGSCKDYEIPRLLNLTGTGISFEGNEIKELKELILYLLDGNFPFNFSPNIDLILEYSRERQSLKFLNEIFL